jgi:hypothetical protein
MLTDQPGLLGPKVLYLCALFFLKKNLSLLTLRLLRYVTTIVRIMDL